MTAAQFVRIIRESSCLRFSIPIVSEGPSRTKNRSHLRRTFPSRTPCHNNPRPTQSHIHRFHRHREHSKKSFNGGRSSQDRINRGHRYRCFFLVFFFPALSTPSAITVCHEEKATSTKSTEKERHEERKKERERFSEVNESDLESDCWWLRSWEPERRKLRSRDLEASSTGGGSFCFCFFFFLLFFLFFPGRR